ncbi:hypothetical protein [Streptomyces olivaceus]|uniref:hypothetical protein n=1 Tax=Streptomyces olivaceus TaxID=47716 RepID=UPI003F4BF320
MPWSTPLTKARAPMAMAGMFSCIRRMRCGASWNLGSSWNSAATENQVTGTAPAWIMRCTAALWASGEGLPERRVEEGGEAVARVPES